VNIKSWKIFDEEDRGALLPIEFDGLPFRPKRVFVVKNVPINTSSMKIFRK